MRMNAFVGVALGSALCAVYSQAAEGWGTDFEAGLAAAEKGDRLVLVEFTGSDWCSACKILESKILPTKEFTGFTSKNRLVLVELDYPRDTKNVTPEQRAARQKVAERYNIRAYPTLLLVDSKGQPYGRIEGVLPTPEQNIKRLQSIVDMRKQFKKRLSEARKAETPAARALALQAALLSLPDGLRPHHTALVEEIIQNDPEDTLGYRKALNTKNLREKQLDEVKETLLSAVGDRKFTDAVEDARAAALKLLEREDFLPFVRLSLNAYVSQTFVAQGEFSEALKYMDAAIAADPESAEAKEMQTKGRPMLQEMIRQLESAGNNANR